MAFTQNQLAAFKHYLTATIKPDTTLFFNIPRSERVGENEMVR